MIWLTYSVTLWKVGIVLSFDLNVFPMKPWTVESFIIGWRNVLLEVSFPICEGHHLPLMRVRIWTVSAESDTCLGGQVMGPPPRNLKCLSCHTGWTLETMDDPGRYPEQHKARSERGWVRCMRTLPSLSHFELFFQLHRIYSICRIYVHCLFFFFLH